MGNMNIRFTVITINNKYPAINISNDEKWEK